MKNQEKKILFYHWSFRVECASKSSCSVVDACTRERKIDRSSFSSQNGATVLTLKENTARNEIKDTNDRIHGD